MAEKEQKKTIDETAEVEQEEETYEQTIRRHPLMRIMSVVCLVILAALIVAVLITGITGSPYFMGCLVLMIIVPVLMYVILWIGKVLNRQNQK